MLKSVKDLQGLTLGAPDGDIGAVEEFYFDDEKWTVRYLVVDTGRWLPGRKVLISPISVDAVDWDGKRLHVKLTQQQIKDSPDMESHNPVSRQRESLFFKYYGYPFYWTGPYVWGPAPFPEGLPVQVYPEEESARTSEVEEDSHLHSTREVTGYYIEATDGDIGHVDDFMLDDRSWELRYVVVDTRNWLPGKKVLIAPPWIHRVSWRDSRVYVNLSREAVQNSPEYDSAAPVSREYESRLYRHYDRPSYWD